MEDVSMYFRMDPELRKWKLIKEMLYSHKVNLAAKKISLLKEGNFLDRNRACPSRVFVHLIDLAYETLDPGAKS